MKTKFGFLIFLTAGILSGCSTALDVTGDYKETMVVYGLLDQSQPKQYIKINKAFLGQGNSLSYAQIKDSSQYVHALTVKLKRVSDGTEYSLLPDNSIPKDPGVFYSPDQANAIYSFDSEAAHALYVASDYKLTVTNSITGQQVSAQTSLISSIGSFTSPVASSSATPVFSFINGFDNFRFYVRWNSAKNAKVYQLAIRFNYRDSTITGNDTLHLDWLFPSQTTQSIAGGEAMEVDFLGQDYLKFIGNQLSNSSKQVIDRKALKTDLMLTAGAEDLNTYIQVNAPSTGIVQERPNFTNITNGLGIFSARYNEPLTNQSSRNLHATTLDSLACGRYTKTLKFLNGQGNLIVCQ
ncbi:MAG: DUF4249 family protein [Bacteroidota bacterium]